MKIPSQASYIINTLYNNGFEAFLVGGCVRDSLLQKSPQDYDITTNALPEDVCRIFDKTIPTGIKHGTITVMVENNAYEVTTYRIDGEYLNNRSPEEVIFVSNIKEDLARRDFTINALAYNDTDGLLDFFNGIDDLNNGIIRCVGDPNKRFNEDALRMLRAIRFSSQLGFSIEESTLRAISQNSSLIQNISVERIADELNKCLLSNNPSNAFILLEHTGLLKYILPELQACVGFDQHTPYHNKDVFMHSLSVVDKVSPKLYLRLAALFHDIAKPPCFFIDEKSVGHFYGHDKEGEIISKEILKRLHYDNDTINKVTILIREHMNVLFKPKDASLKRLIGRVSKELVFDLLELQKSDILSCAPPFLALDSVELMKVKITAILESSVPIHSRDLKINGNDIIQALNIKPGKQVGEILEYLLNLTLDNPELNTRENLLCLLETFKPQ
ncbi:CCA tRNA nucleotidyltransferase [Inconstantimicrobium mannanitabidum]|uniref:HDIG domain-containing protein n=1 Tax=Inconstantimicrobium mannanitabidum TaxID=1604901 RepID=A0ACB5RH79_9CLOT|nr:CCA tRNA nucleotidyltransferase [Clostridium sp. TW13]GKX68421.1 HDIG domain-containing protein [Clostridium sp. TW13]